MTIQELSKKHHLAKEVEEDVKGWAMDMISMVMCGHTIAEMKIKLTANEFPRYMRDINEAYAQYDKSPVDPNQQELKFDESNKGQ